MAWYLVKNRDHNSVKYGELLGMIDGYLIILEL
jgi:hypothetical protein